ncbi:hypothetical protein FRC02_008551 [Tulasnella sp. 418]|nr:hypothetical protein FRC02_008551 [Tulasnella sp. 418]
MSVYSISSTYPEPATSPSPRSSPMPTGSVHAPLRRTYAFYIPRKKISVPSIGLTQPTSTSQSRRAMTRRRKGPQPTRLSQGVRQKQQEEGDEERQNEPEDTMAPHTKRRKIKN